MNIKIDTVAKAIYISLRDVKVTKTIEIAPELFVDLDYKGEPIGIEMINPGKLEIKQMVKKVHLPDLARPPVKNFLETAQEVFA